MMGCEISKVGNTSVRHAEAGAESPRTENPRAQATRTSDVRFDALQAPLARTHSPVPAPSVGRAAQASETIGSRPQALAAGAASVAGRPRSVLPATAGSPAGAAVPASRLSSASSPSATALREINPTPEEKDQLFALYHKTYASFSDPSLLMNKADFAKRIDDYYDKTLVERDAHGQINNAVLCWEKGNSKGCKVCLIFGSDTPENKESRVANLIGLLKDPSKKVYIEASGPIAARILKDKNVPVAISLDASPESLHYRAKKTPFGKKVILGNAQHAHIVSPEMREFYSLLNDYNKTKLKMSKAGAGSEASAKAASDLVALFGTAEKSGIPQFFKGVLANKIAKRMSGIENLSGEQEQAKAAMNQFAKAHIGDVNVSVLEMASDLSVRDREVLATLLTEKKDKVASQSAD
jgi:hypothetical protein